MYKSNIDKIFLFFILVWELFIFVVAKSSDEAQYFEHTESYGFFSEQYCGIVLEFSQSSFIDNAINATIQVDKSLIPYQLSVLYWENDQSSPNFEIIDKPININHQNHELRLKSSKSNPYISIILFSRFAGVTGFNASLLFRGLRNQLYQEINIEYQLLKSILLDTYDLIIPQTVEEGRLYYSNFTELLNNQSFAFHKNQVKHSVHIDTIPRSGTHFLTRMIEEITGEWIGMFPVSNNNGLSLEDYITYQLTPHVKVFVDHGLYMKGVRRIKLVRDILDNLNSVYNANKTSTHDKKMPGKYYLESDYVDFMLYQLEKNRNKSKYHNNFSNVATFRYEDLILNPVETLKEIITCVLGYPVQHTIYYSKIEEIIRTKGLFSAYKTIFNNETESKAKTDLINLVSSDLIEKIFINFPVYNYYFGYFDKYHQYMIDHNIYYDANAINTKIGSVTTKHLEDKEKNIKQIVNKNGYIHYA